MNYKFNSFLPRSWHSSSLFFIYCCSPAQLTTLKVMTFNIRYNNPDDSIYNWDHRKAMVYGVVSKYQPDIAGIQEALHGQMDRSGNALKGYSWFGVGRDDGGEAGNMRPSFTKPEDLQSWTVLHSGFPCLRRSRDQNPGIQPAPGSSHG